MHRREFVPVGEILAQVEDVLARTDPGKIDWVTFVGSGEPTLHSRLGHLIRQVKKTAAAPVAVITNGSLLYRPQVRRELLDADAVMPSLDAGSPELRRRINRPLRRAGYERFVQGLIDFGAAFGGKLWVEVMLIKGINDREDALLDLAGVMERIGPDQIHINLPIRCPAESWVRPPDAEGIALAEEILGRGAIVVRPKGGEFHPGAGESLLEGIIDIVTRHPMRHEELLNTLEERGAGPPGPFIDRLTTTGRVRLVERPGGRFWCAAEARHAE